MPGAVWEFHSGGGNDNKFWECVFCRLEILWNPSTMFQDINSILSVINVFANPLHCCLFKFANIAGFTLIKLYSTHRLKCNLNTECYDKHWILNLISTFRFTFDWHSRGCPLSRLSLWWRLGWSRGLTKSRPRPPVHGLTQLRLRPPGHLDSSYLIPTQMHND